MTITLLHILVQVIVILRIVSIHVHTHLYMELFLSTCFLDLCLDTIVLLLL